MNLTTAAWLPLRFRDGSLHDCPITFLVRNDVVDIELPRADLKGAAYQLLIGMLQTCMAAEDEHEWGELFHEAPSENFLIDKLALINHAFETTGSGPRFMQDFEELDEKGMTSIAALMIDSPGENGIKNNTDFFVKRTRIKTMSWSIANLALFALQINAPAGGAGVRTGLRGGGPITTLITPQSQDATLWQRLWLNVINRDFWRYPDPDLKSEEVFPWLGPTRQSDRKGAEIHQADVHELHMYWAMPRRVRMEPLEENGVCDISGKPSKPIVRQCTTKNCGNNYSGDWAHPLTPYKWDAKDPNASRLSMKGQPGGISYKNWGVLALSTTGQAAGQSAARVVGHHDSVQAEIAGRETPSLWAFAYDLDKMKPRGWYSTELPLFDLTGVDQDQLLNSVRDLQDLAAAILFYTRSQMKDALFESAKNVKGDISFVDLAFWQQTEPSFFNAVAHLIEGVSSKSVYLLTPSEAKKFLSDLQTCGIRLFDYYAFSDLGDQRSTSKRVCARQALVNALFSSKAVKNYRAEHGIDELSKEASV